MEFQESNLQAGYYQVKVTPYLGYYIPGYYRIRQAKGIIEDLYLRATAFSDGEKKAIVFSCDCLSVDTNAADDVRQLIAERCGIEPEAVYLHATHSHTSFRVEKPDEDGTECDTFCKWLYMQFADCAEFAFRDLKPCKLLRATGDVDNVGFSRIYRMKDGSCETNPGIGNPDAVDFFGKQDTSLQLIRIVRENAKEILFVNFGTHADVITTKTFSPDWPGYLANLLVKTFDGQVEAMTLVGCQGNSNHVNVFNTADTLQRTDPYSRRMARILAGEVLKIYDGAQELDSCGIDFCRMPVKVGRNPWTPEQVPIAKEIHTLYCTPEYHDQTHPIFKKYPITVPEACRIVRSLTLPEFTTVTVSALRLGGMNFVGIPGEPFCSIGMDLKEGCDKPVIVTCLTNGSDGYFPDAEAFKEKGYERESSIMAHNVGQLLADAGVAAVKKLNP